MHKTIKKQLNDDRQYLVVFQVRKYILHSTKIKELQTYKFVEIQIV